MIQDLVSRLGPVVGAYPTWHPLMRVTGLPEGGQPRIDPKFAGFPGIDHEILFRNGFITAPHYDPYPAISDFAKKSAFPLRVERLDMPFYAPTAYPVIVLLAEEYGDSQNQRKLVGGFSSAFAVASFIHNEVNYIGKEGIVAEPWSSMRSLVFGLPHSAECSYFVDREVGRRLKRFYSVITECGVFGPPKMG